MCMWEVVPACPLCPHWVFRSIGWGLEGWHLVSTATSWMEMQSHQKNPIVFTMRGIHCGEAAEILHNLRNWTLISYPRANYCLWSVLRGRSSASSDVRAGVEGISCAGDQSWSESSAYRTLKTAPVCTKLSCSLKAASLAVSLMWCASAAPLNSHQLVGTNLQGVQLQSHWLCLKDGKTLLRGSKNWLLNCCLSSDPNVKADSAGSLHWHSPTWLLCPHQSLICFSWKL